MGLITASGADIASIGNNKTQFVNGICVCGICDISFEITMTIDPVTGMPTTVPPMFCSSCKEMLKHYKKEYQESKKIKVLADSDDLK